MPETITSHNPATGKEIWRCQAATESEVNTIVSTADRAFNEWSKLTVEDRIIYLIQYSEVLMSRQEALALALSEENGKLLWEARNEVQSMIQKIAISIEAYRERCPEHHRELQPNLNLYTRFKPHGVVAILGPFNFPGHLPNGHMVPALLAGNTVVFKPSERTPRFGEFMMDCWRTCEPYNGIANIVQGSKKTAQALVKHPLVKGVFFTGSEGTGKALSEMLAKHPEKILALEMGGNNPLVIGEIENLQAAAYLTIQSAYLSSGQRCSCARRLIVLRNETGEAFLKTLKKMIEDLKIGFFSDLPEPFMGPLISVEAAEKIVHAQESLVQKGGKSLVTLRQVFPDLPLLTPGLIDVTAIENRADEELFGPLLQVIRVNNLQEAFQEAVKTRFGLTAGIITDRREEYLSFLRFIPAGVINWNTPLTGASSLGPFGGWVVAEIIDLAAILPPTIVRILLHHWNKKHLACQPSFCPV